MATGVSRAAVQIAKVSVTRKQYNAITSITITSYSATDCE